ncbi:heterokaryon incompatibility protein-domain-containing protein [Ampelomyces quisqualis]|uniref:Heterokaryon incompatibility protein-domain-containing protein n=1 Tax=Ampelomyces quisqualis TaxID=50730 RepID=A0A6A5R2I6_AMPQU|nr:heterokaryon incompatibility protein-domain-containing protein [Ampelomyces quisqualis]
MTNKTFEYLALSHMWGEQSVEHLKLGIENLEDFQEDIPWHRLSSIYKEAIHVTAELGYRYLWIDSLCIIQNDDDDWSREASLMATVYGNATCNLAFIFPSLTPSTTFRSDPRIYNPCVLRAATSSSPGIYIQRDTRDLRVMYQSIEYYGWLAQHNWPLFSRAWTFQEYLLCPRTLLLGHRNLMWQCSAFFYDELLGPIAESLPNGAAKKGRDGAKSRYFPMNILKPGFAAYADMSDLMSLSFMIDWQALLNEYRSRELTEAKDRVVAFAGIARAFTNLGSLTYLAGTWADFFPLCLLWYVDRKREVTIRYAGPEVIRGGFVEYPVKVCEEVVRQAPSWSQFNVPIYTHHQTYFIFNNDEIFVRQKSLYEQPRVCWDDLYWAELDSFQFSGQPVNHFPDSGFFDFSNLSATLDLPVLPVKVSWPAHLEQHFEHIRATDPLEAALAWKPDFTYYPDSPLAADKIATPPRRGVLALIAEFQVCRVAGKYLVQRRLAGLVLVRAEKVGTWRRVGAWKLTIKISGVEATPENIQDTAARWKKYRIWTIGEAWQMETVTLV